MSVIRVGSSGTYAEGWDFVFGSAKTKQRASKTKGRAAAGKKATKNAAKNAENTSRKKKPGRKPTKKARR